MPANFFHEPRKCQIWRLNVHLLSIQNAPNLFFAARTIDICAFYFVLCMFCAWARLRAAPKIWKIGKKKSKIFAKRTWNLGNHLSMRKRSSFRNQKTISNSQRNFFHEPKKFQIWTFERAFFEQSKCSKSVRHSARYWYLCILRRFLRNLRLSVDVRAGKHVPEDVVGREWLKEETLDSCRLGHRQTLSP